MDQAVKPAVNPKEVEGYASCFLHFHSLWKSNQKKEYADAVQQKLAIAANPYKLCLVCVKLCPDLYRNKSTGMAANMVVELQSFLDKQSKDHYSSCLTEDMQKEVFCVAVKQKNTGMMRLLVKAYQLRDIREELIPHLSAMINQQQYKDVCTLATLLDLQHHFTTEELIIPLFCADRLCLADEYLDSSPTHQKELVLFIDSVIGKEPDSCNVLKKHNIMDVSRFKTTKVLSTILAKLLKRYQLDMSLCPHLYKRRAVGGLRYLFYKYYIEKGLQTTAFHSLVEDALEESPDLKHSLMCLFCEYCDPQSAVPYVHKLHLKSEEIPHQIVDVMGTVSQFTLDENCQNALEASQEEFGDQEEESYSLSLPLESVTFVDTVEKFENCMEEVSNSSVIGLDSEWKPTFGIGNAEQVALIQLATLTHVYLVDIISLRPLLDQAHWVRLGRVFTDANIIKLGYGIKCDFKILAKMHPDFKKAIASPKNVMDLDQKKSVLLEASPEIFSHSASSVKGLSDLVYRCFGKPLNKNEQFSNWANRPLSRQQELYAALDARCLIDIYNYLNTKSQELGIGDWWNIKPNIPSTKPKRQKNCEKKVQSTPGKVSSIGRRNGPIAAKDFHVVCDTMLQGLAKKLRLCGIDAVALENGQSSDCCIDYFEKEGRIVMSRGAAYQRLRKFVPAEFLCHVENEGARQQLNEVMETFNVRLSSADIFARCTKCNSGSYLTVSPSVIRKMKRNENKGCSSSLPGDWVTVEYGKVNVVSGLTMDGVKVKCEKVLVAAIAKAKEVYICSKCGKCYWEGSHQERAFREIITPYLHGNDVNSERHGPDLDMANESQTLDKPLDTTVSSNTTDDSFENNFPDKAQDCSVVCGNDIEKQIGDLSIS